MPGRRPKPTVLHRLQGTYNATNHGRDRAREPIASGDLTDAPADLTPTQEQAWRYAIKHAPRGILHSIDRDILRLWVETLDRRNEAQQLLETETSALLWITSPCHRVIDRTTTLLIRLASELGFSPAARPRLQVTPPPPVENDADPWQMLRLLPGGKTSA
jgi:P27 family predicted phage terminase small subunit